MRPNITTMLTLTAALGGATLAAGSEPAAAAADQEQGMAIMSAFVEIDGTLRQGNGVVDSERVSEGRYVLTLNRNVAFGNCTLASTPIGTSIVSLIGMGPDNTVQIGTHLLTGQNSSAPFQVMIFCVR